MTLRHPRAILVAAALLTACSGGEDGEVCGDIDKNPGPMMRPGENCLGCHQDGFGDDAPEFTAAGTIFASVDSDHCDGVEGVKVILTGADGSPVETQTNAAGNFWTTAPLMKEGPGPTIELEGRTITMQRALPTIPACNACHSDDPVGGASGKIYVP